MGWIGSVADLAGEEQIAPTHLAEALQYRPKLEMMQTLPQFILASFLDGHLREAVFAFCQLPNK